VGLYDAGIFYADGQFARLLQRLRVLGVEDDTVVIVTADHGEAFLDYLFFLHKELRPPLLRVPLMVRDPGRPAAVVAERVALADIPPTVLERAGLAIPEGMTGRPLPTSPRASGPPRVFPSYYRFRERHFYEAYALLDGPWKLVYQRLARAPDFRADLYDTRSDPEERHPVTDEPERMRAMLARLKAWIAAPDASRAERIELDATTREELRALGYLE
jgi:arylsulfatase A-like enzyme